MLKCLDNLDRLCASGKLGCLHDFGIGADVLRPGKLNERETTFGAALLAFVEGRYTSAAVMLEGAVHREPYDLIAMRLAQDCFMQAGDGEGALRCVSQRMNQYHDTHEMHGHVLGMLAVGLVERGLFQEGEDTGQHAVMATKGEDTNAVQSVLSGVHLTFRSMSLSREISDYAANNPGPGRHPFSFFEGNFQLHQGNFNGALESFDMLLERISDPSTRFLSSLVYATMLLLQIDLQVEHLAVDSRWERLGGFWDTMQLGKGNIFASPLTEFCSATTYSRIMCRRESRGATPLPPAVSDVKLTGFFSILAPKRVNLEHVQSLAAEKWESWLRDADCRADSSAEDPAQSSWQEWVRSNCTSLRSASTQPMKYPPVLPELPVDFLTRDQRCAAWWSLWQLPCTASA